MLLGEGAKLRSSSQVLLLDVRFPAGWRLDVAGNIFGSDLSKSWNRSKWWTKSSEIVADHTTNRRLLLTSFCVGKDVFDCPGQ